MTTLASAPFAETDWVDLGQALERFSAATGLCVTAYGVDAVRRAGPFYTSRVARLLDDSGAWDPDGAAHLVEAELVTRAAGERSPARSVVGGEMQVLALPVSVDGQPVGVVVFGWVFSAFSTSMGCQRLAPSLGVDAARLWAEVRLEPPVAEARLCVSSQLLETMLGLLDRHIQAIDSLHKLARMRESFLAFVSHELRTPLSVLATRIELLLRGKLDQPEVIREHLLKMKRHVGEESRLVEDLIESARSRNGQLGVELQPVLLREALQSAVDTVRPTAEAKSISLLPQSVDLPDGLLLSGDVGRLQQVFWNLLANAVKFTPTGGQVWLTVHNDISMLYVSVSDTGAGIEAALLPFVFEPFTRERRNNQSGLGLGLSIAKHIVEQHGGSITVRSDGPGLGSTFTVALPRLANDAAA